MIIEFIGLPGSGKSTLCEELEPWLKEQGYSVVNWLYHTASWSKFHRIAHKLKVSIKFFFTHPLIFQNLGVVVKRSGQGSLKGSLSQYLNLIYIAGLYWRYNHPRFDSKVVLFDQGKIQAITSLIFQSKVKDLQKLLPLSLTKIYGNDLVIYIDVTPEELLKRLEMRNGAQSRVERLAPEERIVALKQFQERGEKVLTLDFLYEKLIRIDGRGKERKELLEAVKSLLNDQLHLT
jgi:thymidylate kinase